MGVETDFGIGELARRTKRSVHAIRWYEQQGLIPRVERDAGGRRRYVARHVEWLLFLERLKVSAMPVKEMKRWRQGRDPGARSVATGTSHGGGGAAEEHGRGARADRSQA